MNSGFFICHVQKEAAVKRILFLSFLVLTIVTSIIAGTMATYTKTLESLKGSVAVKQFYVGSTETVFPKIKLAPTESTVWNFSIINYQNNFPTEVDMDLDITVNLGPAENKMEIDGLTMGLYEGETQWGTTILRNGTIEVTIPKAFRANVKAQRDFSLKLLWLNGAVSDTVDTLNADYFNTSKISVTVTGRQSIELVEPVSIEPILQSNLDIITAYTRYVIGRSTSSTYHTFGKNYDPTRWNGLLELILEQGSETGMNGVEAGDNAINIVNPVSGKKSIFNYRDVLSEDYADYIPPVVLITNRSNYSYTNIEYLSSVDKDNIKGTIIVYRQNPASDVQVFYVDENGDKSSFFHLVKTS